MASRQGKPRTVDADAGASNLGAYGAVSPAVPGLPIPGRNTHNLASGSRFIRNRAMPVRATATDQPSSTMARSALPLKSPSRAWDMLFSNSVLLSVHART